MGSRAQPEVDGQWQTTDSGRTSCQLLLDLQGAYPEGIRRGGVVLEASTSRRGGSALGDLEQTDPFDGEPSVAPFTLFLFVHINLPHTRPPLEYWGASLQRASGTENLGRSSPIEPRNLAHLTPARTLLRSAQSRIAVAPANTDAAELPFGALPRFLEFKNLFGGARNPEREALVPLPRPALSQLSLGRPLFLLWCCSSDCHLHPSPSHLPSTFSRNWREFTLRKQWL